MANVLEKKREKKDDPLDEAVNLMKVLSHPLRLSILCKLIHNGEMTAGDIVAAEAPHFSQSQVSQYLGILREMGYVATRREGQIIWYAIDDKNVKKMVETLYALYCSPTEGG